MEHYYICPVCGGNKQYKSYIICSACNTFLIDRYSFKERGKILDSIADGSIAAIEAVRLVMDIDSNLAKAFDHPIQNESHISDADMVQRWFNMAQDGVG